MASAWQRMSLSPDEFFLLWWAAELGETPTVLEIPRLGHTPEERTRHAIAASALLRARGLGSVDEPTPELARLLHDLRDATVTVELRGHGVHGEHRVLGALTGTSAVIAARTADTITLGRTHPTTLAGSMIGVLTPLPAGPGGAANVTATDLHRACAAGVTEGVPGFLRVLHAAGVRPMDATTLAKAFDGRRGGGQLGVRVRGARQVSGPVTWLDTAAGRYALRRRDEWVSATPAAVSRLMSMAEELLTASHPAGGATRGVTTAVPLRDLA